MQTIKGPEPEFIKQTFNSISSNYDKANDVITLGMVKRWRKKFVELSGAKKGDHVLDCATGTGDLAFCFKEVVGSEGYVLGTDFCDGMLDEAPKKAQQMNLDVDFELADATQLPYEDNRFDITSIGYGIRNVVDPLKVLQEMARVTKSGGKVMILETGDTGNPFLQPFITAYFKYLVPRLGGWAGGNKKAYEYLNQSSTHFPSKEKFVALMDQSEAFKHTEFSSLMGGASFIYKGIVK